LGIEWWNSVSITVMPRDLTICAAASGQHAHEGDLRQREPRAWMISR
jgi:hypothetical protein